MADVDSAKSVVDFRNQSVPIALNIEDRALPRGVGARKRFPYVCQIFPLSPLRNPKPRVQWNLEFAASGDGLLELLTADYVHAIRRSESAFLRFASCEHHTSRNAKLSSSFQIGSLR